MPEDDLIGTAEAGEILGVSQRMVLRHIEEGHLSVKKRLRSGVYLLSAAEARKLKAKLEQKKT